MKKGKIKIERLTANVTNNRFDRQEAVSFFVLLIVL